MTTTLRARVRELRHQDLGATAVEYALMVTFIALVIVVAVALIGTNLSAFFANAATRI